MRRSRLIPALGPSFGCTLFPLAVTVAIAWIIADSAALHGQTSRDAAIYVEESAVPAQTRMREGTAVDELPGFFELEGDRPRFVFADHTRRWIVLENLNLERIQRIVAARQSVALWNVSGTVTEYRGENYLLVTRAVAGSALVHPSSDAARLPAGAAR